MLSMRPIDPSSAHPAMVAAVTALRGVTINRQIDQVAEAVRNEDGFGVDFTAPSSFALGVKRTLDVGLVLLAMPLVLPVMAVIAMMVKVTSRGPVLFRHERVGRDGQLFKVLKFRTMVPGTHESIWSDLAKIDEFAASGFKLADRDPAITKFGRVLRRTSLDELPQLFNVLGGSMSLVGVRPLVVPEVSMRRPVDQILYRSMKPGITGLWQVNGRSSVEAQERCELDRNYVLQWSLRRDLVILLRTPMAVLRTHHAA